MFFRTHLFDPEDVYIIVGDETIKPKNGENTYGLDRFFSSIYGKAIPSLAFLALSLVSVKERRSYPMTIEQIVKDDTSSDTMETSVSKPDATPKATVKRPRGRPKGSKNRNKTDVEITGILKQLQSMIKTLLVKVSGSIPLHYLVLDGYFGHNNALQMTHSGTQNNIGDYKIL